MTGFFVTGTDTGVGKTWVTRLMLRALNDAGWRAAGFKPICCGDRADVEALRVDGVSADEINPVWLKVPASPLAAGLIEGREVDIPAVMEALRRLVARFDCVLVEGAGGWEVPVRRDYFMSDLAAAMGLPVIVVVNNRLGALNHARLTVQAIRRRGLSCAGVVLNQPADSRDPASISNRVLIEDVTGVPVLAEVLHGAEQLEAGVLERLITPTSSGERESRPERRSKESRSDP